MNFKEINLEISAGRKIAANKISVCHGKNKVLTFNAVCSELVKEKGFSRVRVFEDSETKVMSFVFGNEGILIQLPTSNNRTVKIQHKKLVEYVCKFFDLPPMNTQDFLNISENKSRDTNSITFFVGKGNQFEVVL